LFLGGLVCAIETPARPTKVTVEIAIAEQNRLEKIIRRSILRRRRRHPFDRICRRTGEWRRDSRAVIRATQVANQNAIAEVCSDAG
jgi:hypothetical protein